MFAIDLSRWNPHSRGNYNHYQADIEGGHNHGTHDCYLTDDDHHERMTFPQFVNFLSNLINVGEGAVKGIRYLGKIAK